MKRLLAVFAALVLLSGAGSLAESAEVSPAPPEGAYDVLEPVATPTMEPLPPFPAANTAAIIPAAPAPITAVLLPVNPYHPSCCSGKRHIPARYFQAPQRYP